MKNSIKTELWKAIHNPYFLLSLLAGMLMIFCDVVQNAVSVKTLTEANMEAGLIGNGFDGFSLFVRWIAVNGFTFGCRYFYLVWPILAAMPFGWSYCQEMRSGMINQYMTRGTRVQYFVSKYIAVFISGGIAVSLPVLVNLLLNALVCPYNIPVVTRNVTSIFDGWFLSELFYTNPWVYAFIWCGVEFLIGGATATLCFVVGSRMRFQVMVMLFPFIVCYALDLVSNFVLNSVDLNLTLSPLFLAMAGTGNANPEWLVFLMIGLFSGLSFIIGYWRVMKNEVA